MRMMSRRVETEHWLSEAAAAARKSKYKRIKTANVINRV
jgi:hypothetical protein